MANTLIAISTTTISVPAVSLTLTSIPQTYTDLMLRISSRSSSAAYYEGYEARLNGSGNIVTNLTYNMQTAFYTGGIGGSSANTNTIQYLGYSTAASNPASLFGITDVYLPNYTSSTYKASILSTVSESASVTQNQILMYLGASSSFDTNPITSLYIVGSGNFIAGSKFELYGILRA